MGGFIMKWFKHYENAHSNNFLQALLMEKNGHELYACWFLLLEFLCKEFKKDTTIFVVSSEQLKTVFRVRQDAKLKKILESFLKFSRSFDENLLEFSEVSSKTPELSKKFYEIKTPIILELIGKDFKRARHGRGNGTPKNKEEEKELEKEKNNKKSDCLNHQKIIDAYNRHAPENKKHQSFFLAPVVSERLEISSGFPGLDTLADWENVFKKAFASDFLKEKSWCNLLWLLDADNAQKVLENSYGSGEDRDNYWAQMNLQEKTL